MDKNAQYTFGSHHFIAELERFFDGQAELLGDLLTVEFKKRTKEILPLIIGIHENARTIVWLKKRNLLNEAIVIARIFVERIVTFCYLQSIDDALFASYLRPRDPSIRKDQETQLEITPDEVIRSARAFHSTYKDPVSKINTHQKIDHLKDTTNIPVDLFLIAVATFYPDSEDILEGSLQGCLAHLKTISPKNQELTKHLRDQFSMIFFLGGLLIDQMIGLLAKQEDILKIPEVSKNNAKLAGQLMEGASSKPAQAPGAPGLWYALEEMELSSRYFLSKQISLFEKPFRLCYECGVEVPTLRSKQERGEDIRTAALFLKRSLNDFRSVWVLIQLGYTSQAASVAAALFEHALAVTCLVGNQANTAKFLKNKRGDLPWSPQDLSKMAADVQRAAAVRDGKKFSNDDYEMAWREIYAGYKWLSKIKHPTSPSVTHDAGSTEINDPETNQVGLRGYVVMAAPDIRNENLPVKATVLLIAFRQCHQAIVQFFQALDCDYQDELCKEFQEKLEEASRLIIQSYQAVVKQPLPFDLSQTSLTEEYINLRNKNNV